MYFTSCVCVCVPKASDDKTYFLSRTRVRPFVTAIRLVGDIYNLVVPLHRGEFANINIFTQRRLIERNYFLFFPPPTSLSPIYSFTKWIFADN